MRTKQRRVQRLGDEPEVYACRRCTRPLPWFRFPLPQVSGSRTYLQPCFQCGKAYRAKQKEAAGDGV